MKRLMLLSSAFFLSATMAMAEITADELVAAYQVKGYTRIEVTTGLTQIKVEAIMGKAKVEVVYDALTGAILHEETGWAKGSERGTGIEVKSEDHDFLNGDEHGDENSGDNADEDDHDHSGSGSGDDEGDNDNGGQGDHDGGGADD